jgi:CRP-like cAMP-binding protein
VDRELIVKNITRWIPLSDAEIDFFTSRLIYRKIRRRQYILQAGDVCRHYTFVDKGCLRLYSVDENGTEHILQFAPEDYWVADIGSFHEEAPTSLYIEALEPTEVLQITKLDLISTYIHYPAFDRVFRVMVERAFVGLQRRVLQNIGSTAEERYLIFAKNYPQLVNRLPQTQIASYIGITPEFLSKIRKKLTQRNPSNLKQV